MSEEKQNNVETLEDNASDAAETTENEATTKDEDNSNVDAVTKDENEKKQSDEASNEIDSVLNNMTESHVTKLVKKDKTYYIVGTAHVSENSRLEVANLIEKVHPDTVAVELCQDRYDSFKDENRWAKLDLFQVILKGKFLFLLANLAVGAYQRRMGAELGVKPGAELMGAVEVAEKNGCRLALIDRNINTTLKRVWANLGFMDKLQLLGAIVESLFEDSKEEKVTSESIEDMKKDANLSEMMDMFAKEMPKVHGPLIDERDRYLCAKMRETEGHTVVAVVGAGHVNGIKNYFEQNIDTTKLDVVPPPSIFWKLFKWLFPVLIIGLLVYSIHKKDFGTATELMEAWVLPNSIFCLLGALLARSKPLTALLAILVSPITSLIPVIGAGMVLGLIEALLRKPTVTDCEDVAKVHTLGDFYENPVTHTLIVCFLTTLGSALGAYVGIGWMLVILGIK